MKIKSLLLGSIAAMGISAGAFANETFHNDFATLGKTFANNLVASGADGLMSIQKTADGLQVRIFDVVELTQLDAIQKRLTDIGVGAFGPGSMTIELTAAEFGAVLMAAGVKLDDGMSDQQLATFAAAYTGATDGALTKMPSDTVPQSTWLTIRNSVASALQNFGERISQRPYTEVGSSASAFAA